MKRNLPIRIIISMAISAFVAVAAFGVSLLFAERGWLATASIAITNNELAESGGGETRELKFNAPYRQRAVQMSFLSMDVLDSAFEQIGVTAARGFKSRVSAKSPTPGIVQVSAFWKDEATAAKLLQAVLEKRSSLDASRYAQMFQALQTTVDGQIQIAETDHKAVIAELTGYGQGKKTMAEKRQLAGSAASVLELVARAVSTEAEMTARLEEAQSLLKVVETGKGSDSLWSLFADEGFSLATSRNALSAAELELATARAKFGDGNPRVTALVSQVESARGNLRHLVASYVKDLAVKLQGATASRKALEAEAKKFTQQEGLALEEDPTYAYLVGKRDSLTDVLARLKESRMKMAISASSPNVTWRIIKSVETKSGAFSFRGLMLAALVGAVAGALCLGILSLRLFLTRSDG